MVKVKETYFKTQYRPADTLHNINAMIYFIFKLQLKFRNENYSSVILNFHTGLRYKCIDIKPKLRKNRRFHQKRAARRTISSLLSHLNHFRSASLTSLRSGFRNRLILDPFCSNPLTVLVVFLQIVWIVEFRRQNSRNTSAVFFPFSVCRIALHFPPKLRTFLLFVTVAALLFCRCPVDCSSRKAEGNLRHRVNYRYCCNIQDLKFMSLLEGRGDFTILKIVYYLENYIGTDDWQCRYMRGRCSCMLY